MIYSVFLLVFVSLFAKPTQMAAPYWVSVAVVLLMTVTNGVTVTNIETTIEPHKLAPIVQDILNR